MVYNRLLRNRERHFCNRNICRVEGGGGNSAHGAWMTRLLSEWGPVLEESRRGVYSSASAVGVARESPGRTRRDERVAERCPLYSNQTQYCHIYCRLLASVSWSGLRQFVSGIAQMVIHSPIQFQCCSYWPTLQVAYHHSKASNFPLENTR